MKPIFRSYLAEINLGTTVPGAGQNINFQDYPQLRDVFLTGVIVSDVNTLSVSPAGKAVVSDMSGITVTFMDKYNMEMIYQYPLKSLDPINNSGFYRDFVPFELQLTKSYITILDPAALVANESVMLNIFYVPRKNWSNYVQAYTRK
jgi:hypothetical protein